MTVFPPDIRSRFAAHYPESICALQHRLGDNPLMELDSLAALADGLPANSVECLQSDLPIGVDGAPAQTGRSGGDTIRDIANARSWVMLKRVEQNPAYRELLHDLLAELRPEIEAATGPMLTLQSFIFITSAGGITPFHFDPEHNILMQVRGTKTITILPAGDPRFAPHEMHEAYHRGGGAELAWKDEFAEHGRAVPLEPGRAVYVPVMSPHFVRNGPDISISLSVTWRSEWSYAEADARAFNGLLRSRGLQPAPPARWPRSNWTKASAYRVLRKLGAVD